MNRNTLVVVLMYGTLDNGDTYIMYLTQEEVKQLYENRVSDLRQQYSKPHQASKLRAYAVKPIYAILNLFG